MKRVETKLWIEKAENDLKVVRLVLADGDGPWDALCFHAQQASEKMLKAFLVENGVCPARTHNLVSILYECLKLDNTLENLAQKCRQLDPFAVVIRYPDDERNDPSRSDAEEAVEAAETIYKEMKQRIYENIRNDD